MRKHTHRKERTPRTDTLTVAMKGVSYLPEDEAKIRLDAVNKALELVLEGTANDTDWCNISAAYNVILVLANQRGVLAGQPTEFCAVVAETINAVYSNSEGGRVPTPEEAEVFKALLNLFANVLESVPQRIINKAELTAYDRLRSKSGVLDLRH